MIRVFLTMAFPAGAAIGTPVTEEHVEHAASKFRVVRTEPDQVRVAWKDDKGVPYPPDVAGLTELSWQSSGDSSPRFLIRWKRSRRVPSLQRTASRWLRISSGVRGRS